MPERREKDIAGGPLRLQHRQPIALGDLFDGRGDQGAAGTALRFVRLGDDADELRPLGQQRFQARHREVGGAEEEPGVVEQHRHQPEERQQPPGPRPRRLTDHHGEGVHEPDQRQVVRADEAQGGGQKRAAKVPVAVSGLPVGPERPEQERVEDEHQRDRTRDDDQDGGSIERRSQTQLWNQQEPGRERARDRADRVRRVDARGIAAGGRRAARRHRQRERKRGAERQRHRQQE